MFDPKPFRFEDLDGRPDPAHWGPVYNLDAPSLAKWRKKAQACVLTDDETREYGAAVHAVVRARNAVTPRQGLNMKSNCASGQAGDYSAKKHRASLTANFHAMAAYDRTRWAEGKPDPGSPRTIKRAYAQAMAEKAVRQSLLSNG